MSAHVNECASAVIDTLNPEVPSLEARTPSPSFSEPELEPDMRDPHFNGISGDESVLECKAEEYDLNTTDPTLFVSSSRMLEVMEEYEKTISHLVTVNKETRAQSEKDKETMKAKLDEANQHLRNMEIAFNDIHQKYEELKIKCKTLHANEEELKKGYDAAVETVEAQDVAYQKLKQNATEKINEANAKIVQMKAEAKKNELKCKFLEESLEQKKKELREITQMCDEMVDKIIDI